VEQAPRNAAGVIEIDVMFLMPFTLPKAALNPSANERSHHLGG
jgi:hypothetical protein